MTRPADIRWRATATYERKTPAGTLIARWFCRESHTTFSLVPDCLVARLRGTLKRLEEVVAHAEQAPSLTRAADLIRRDAIELAGAMRWVRRRVRLVQHVPRVVIGLLPQQLAGCHAEMSGSPSSGAAPGCEAATRHLGPRIDSAGSAFSRRSQ